MKDICYIHRSENTKSDFFGVLLTEEKFYFDYRGKSAVAMILSAFVASFRLPRREVYFTEGGLGFWVAYCKKIFFRNTKIVVMAVDPIFNWRRRSRTMNYFLKKAFAKMDYVIPISTLVRDDLRFYSPTIPCTIVHHYVDIENFSDVCGDTSSKNILFAINRPQETGTTKGLDIAISIFKSLRETDSGWKLCIIGNGTEHLNFEDKDIICYGSQNPADYFKRCSIVLVPARYEAFSLVAAEAAISGVVPFISQTSGAREFVKDIEQNLISQHETPELFVKKILWFDALPLSQKNEISNKLKNAASVYTKENSVTEMKNAVLHMNQILGIDLVVKEINNKV